MARARIKPKTQRTKEEQEAVELRFSDNPFMPPLGPNNELRFPEEWDQEAREAYVCRMKETARTLARKEKESGVPFQGETVVIRIPSSIRGKA